MLSRSISVSNHIVSVSLLSRSPLPPLLRHVRRLPGPSVAHRIRTKMARFPLSALLLLLCFTLAPSVAQGKAIERTRTQAEGELVRPTPPPEIGNARRQLPSLPGQPPVGAGGGTGEAGGGTGNQGTTNATTPNIPNNLPCVVFLVARTTSGGCRDILRMGGRNRSGVSWNEKLIRSGIAVREDYRTPNQRSQQRRRTTRLCRATPSPSAGLSPVSCASSFPRTTEKKGKTDIS